MASKELIENFCNTMRPSGEPTSIDTKFYPLTENSGYTVRIVESENEETGRIKSTITKVWKKGGEGWKMVHFHATSQPIAEATVN